LQPEFCATVLCRSHFGGYLNQPPKMGETDQVSTTMNSANDPPTLDLHAAGVQALIKLTNSQFAFWEGALRRETKEDIPAGNLMDYWFIMSELALHGPDFRIVKKETFDSVPNLKPETVRKHIAAAGKLGFVDTVRSKGIPYLQLTIAGQRAVAMTLARWVDGFSEIQDEHFLGRRAETK
jgi:hypothetical protein